jgi:YD repeat-containing protein
VVGYSYGAMGNRTTLTSRTVQVGYAYDAANRMEVVTDWDLQNTTYAYDAANRLLTTNLPNGVVSRYDYDDAGRLLSIFHQAGEQLLSSFEYSYDPNGNRVRAVENMLLPETRDAQGPPPRRRRTRPHRPNLLSPTATETPPGD